MQVNFVGQSLWRKGEDNVNEEDYGFVNYEIGKPNSFITNDDIMYKVHISCFDSVFSKIIEGNLVNYTN